MLPGHPHIAKHNFVLHHGGLADSTSLIGFTGRFVLDTSKPHGTPCKLLDVSSMKELGWLPGILLGEGLAVVHWEHIAEVA